MGGENFHRVDCNVMENPKLVNKADHSSFICGNDADAKNKVKHFLVDTFGVEARKPYGPWRNTSCKSYRGLCSILGKPDASPGYTDVQY
jgi:hypothetical protein